MPSKKAKQITNLIEQGNIDAAQKIIADGIRSNNFEWGKQLEKIDKYMNLLKSDSNFDIRSFSAKVIKLNPTMIPKIAYALSFPDFQFGFLIQQTLENNSTVPYDWYLRRNLSINEYEQIIKEMNQNYQSFANEQYNIAYSRIEKNASLPVLGIRKRENLIKEQTSLLNDKHFESARIVSFVLIEGLLWEIVNEVDKKEDFKHSNNNVFVDLQGSTFHSTRIRDVIKQTAVSNYIDYDFIKHFCEELYDERNPVLHGSGQCHTCPNTGICLFGKILVLDYIIEILIDLYKNNLFSQWDNMPDDVKNRVISSILKADN